MRDARGMMSVETVYFLEVLAASRIANPERPTDLMKEADELMGMLVTSAKTIKARGRSESALIIL